MLTRCWSVSSDTAFSPTLSRLDFWNGIFTCNVQTRDSVAWSNFKMNQLSNNHLISADPFIRDRVAEIRIGDQIRIKGSLSRYGAVAYLLTVHATDPSAKLRLLVGSAATGAEQVPTVSVGAKGQPASGAVLVTGDENNDGVLFTTDRGTARAQVDLQGWYVG